MTSLTPLNDERPARSSDSDRGCTVHTGQADAARAPTRTRCARQVHLDEPQLHRLAWGFLGSPLAGLTYADWSLDRRLDAYLTRLGMTSIVNNGDTFDAVLQQVLTNVGPALRSGVLSTATWLTSRRNSLSSISDGGVTSP